MADSSYYHSFGVPIEDNSFCRSSDAPFSIPREYNIDPFVWRQQDLNALSAAYNDSSSRANAGSNLWSDGYAAAIITPTMHPNLVSTLKSLIDIDNNGRNYDHNQASASASAGAGFGYEEKRARSQHGHQSQGECTRGDSNYSRRYYENDQIATVPVDLIQNRRPFKCSHVGCNKTFKNPQTLKMHHKTHLSTAVDNRYNSQLLCSAATNSRPAGHNKKIPSRCPVCHKTFVGLYELRRHYGRKHSEGEKTHGCKKCNKKFYIEVDLRDHEKLCGEPIECKCGMKFAFKCNLVAHKKNRPECIDNNVSSTSCEAQDCKSSENSSMQEKLPCPASNSCQSNSNISSAAVNLFGFENDVIQLHDRLNFHSISGALC